MACKRVVARDRDAIRKYEGQDGGRPKYFFAGKSAQWLPSWLLATAFLVRAACDAFYPLRQSQWMIYEEDDFFYYAKIAKNIAANRGATFNGLVTTNGYHPLWLVLLATFARVFHSQVAMQIFLACCIFVSTAATFFLIKRLFDLHIESELFTTSVAVALTLYSKIILEGGMETILTFPLLLALLSVFQSNWLWRGGFLRFLGFGLLLLVTIFSRLDTLVLVALLAVAAFLQPKLREEMTGRRICGLLVGLSPFLIYVLYNHYSSGTWLTISGAAKQLKTGYLPSWRAWHSVIFNRPVAFLVVLASFRFVFLRQVWDRMTVTQRAAYPAFVAFPFAYVLVFCLSSDWQLWTWYFYCFYIALCVSCALLLVYEPANRIFRGRPAAFAMAFFALCLVIVDHRKPIEGMLPIYVAATEIQAFSETHPGVYAMGDRAGIAGYLLPYPLVQTEGLVMDRKFLDLVKQQAPLSEVLGRYGTNYYVTTTRRQFMGCLPVEEPSQAGVTSPHLRATICKAPLASFLNDGWWTYIFQAPLKP